MDIASVEGLDGLSIGGLASELKLSKSGVFAHFGSKEELQLATIRAARDVFMARVVSPARAAPPGLGRVWALCEAWLAYGAEPVFPGGCFFFATSAEFDARPGRVRDALAEANKDWVLFGQSTIDEARHLGEISGEIPSAQLWFELYALARAANTDALLHGDKTVFERARTGIRNRLQAVATDPSALA